VDAETLVADAIERMEKETTTPQTPERQREGAPCDCGSERDAKEREEKGKKP